MNQDKVRAYYSVDDDSIVVIHSRAESDGSRSTTNIKLPYSSIESLRLLMDDLWNLGVRPTASKYHSDQVEAMSKHIEDLRKIAMGVLKFN